MSASITRRELMRAVASAAAVVVLPSSLRAGRGGTAPELSDDDVARLKAWTFALRHDRLESRRPAFGERVARVGELAIGTPYVPNTLEVYLRGSGDAGREPVTLSLTEFDCVTLVESCQAVARLAGRPGTATWTGFGHEIERMRYRGGNRVGYSSRLHYFSEWISDGAARGLVTDFGRRLGGRVDPRPLRFMSSHRSSYPALASDAVYAEIAAMEWRLDSHRRFVIPKDRIADVANKLETGDILAFATSIPGLDVTHSAYAYRRPDGVMGVLHAPLSGGAVEISRKSLPEYVDAIRTSTGLMVARPHF